MLGAAGRLPFLGTGMSFKTVVVLAIVAISTLEVAAFLIVLRQAHELSDRSIVLLTAILGALGPTVAAMLLLLRVDERQEQTQKKVDDLHHDVLNGALRENVKQAITEKRHELTSRTAAKLARRQLDERGVLERRRQAGKPVDSHPPEP